MTRASLVIAATLLMATAFASAGDQLDVLGNRADAPSVYTPSTTIGDDYSEQPALRIAPSVLSSNYAEDVDGGPPSAAGESVLASQGEGETAGTCSLCGQDCERLVYGNDCYCSPDICRFDHPADTIQCVTDEYCRRIMHPVGNCRQVGDCGGWLCDGCGTDVLCRPTSGPDVAFRFGYWGVDTDGDSVKTGEFQSLKPSPFWDADGIWTDGSRTLDFALTQFDQEATNARGYYYGNSGLSVKVDFEQFLRRLDHDPLSGFDLNGGAPGASDNEVGEDLNVGDDYAIRVQQLNARFQGRLTNNLKWKLNVWSLRKFGERQANATAHCFDLDPAAGSQNNTCHVLSQRQQIDWTTVEVQPVLEARVGETVVEYSRTMRGFGQDDQLVTRTYTRFDFSPSSGAGGDPFLYAFAPETFTQVDRLKVSSPLNDCNQFYANMYLGDTENKFRNTHRDFNGFDFRVINQAIDDVTLTAYAKLDTQKNEVPTDLLTMPPYAIGAGNVARFEPGSLRHPIDYNLSQFGIKGNWRSKSRPWLSVVSGYQYSELARDYADYDTASGLFTQPDTKSHLVQIGPYMRVSSTLNTFVRYKARFNEDPLIGVRENDGMFNSNQPQQEHRAEIGGTWMPTSNFMATTMFGIENRWHDSAYANFDEENYPLTLTLWYAPTERLSLTGGYAYFTNWIDQDITVGFRDSPTERTNWSYGGKNELVSIGANYAWTQRTQFVAGAEWNRGNNSFSVPASPAGADWSLLPLLSDVLVETTRLNLGVDHEITPCTTCYFRYVRFDYEDMSVDYNSGTADMFLAGLTVLH